MKKIIKNAIQCKLCGEIIESTYMSSPEYAQKWDEKKQRPKTKTFFKQIILSPFKCKFSMNTIWNCKKSIL